MPDDVQPLIDVREMESFRNNQAEIERLLKDALPLSKGDFQTREEAGRASDAVRDLRYAIKAAEEQKLETTAPWRASVTHVNNHYKELLGPAEGVVDALKNEGMKFQKRIEAEEREKERQEQERRDREAEQAAKDAQEAAELAEAEKTAEARELADQMRRDAAKKASDTAPSGPKASASGIRGSTSASTYRTEWRSEVVDPEQVPDQLKTINQKAIDAHVKAEVALAKAEKRPVNAEAIPGVRIFSKDIPVNR